ncbi:MAG: PP2C family protein-serine/threonine phosphatase [Frankia sp.]
MTGPALPIALILVLLGLAGLFILAHGLQSRRDQLGQNQPPETTARTVRMRVGGRRGGGTAGAADRNDPTVSRAGGGGGPDGGDRPTRPIPPPAGSPPGSTAQTWSARGRDGGRPEADDATRPVSGRPRDPDDPWDDAAHHQDQGPPPRQRRDADPEPDVGLDLLGDVFGDETARTAGWGAGPDRARRPAPETTTGAFPTPTAAPEPDDGSDDGLGTLGVKPPTAPPPTHPWGDPPAAASRGEGHRVDPNGSRPAGTQGPDWRAEEASAPGQPALRLSAIGRTRAGRKGPNEDAFVLTDGLLAVADGVGGHAAGQVAATLAVSTVAGDRPQHAPDHADALRRAVTRANRVVRERPSEQPDLKGMACTLDVVVLGRRAATGTTLIVGHVGDSTVWLQPGRGRPRQITLPHSIDGGPLLNAIGARDDVRVDLSQEIVAAGDRIIMATDGLTKVIGSEQLDGLLSELGQGTADAAADALLAAAVAAGTRDDTTIVVADVVPEPPARAANPAEQRPGRSTLDG